MSDIEVKCEICGKVTQSHQCDCKLTNIIFHAKCPECVRNEVIKGSGNAIKIPITYSSRLSKLEQESNRKINIELASQKLYIDTLFAKVKEIHDLLHVDKDIPSKEYILKIFNELLEYILYLVDKE